MKEQVQEVETTEEVTVVAEEDKNKNDPLRDRMGFYNLCRSRRKPAKGQLKQITFPRMKKKENTGDYVKRAEKETGVKISSCGVIKKPGRNVPCPCKSGKKFKKCCGRG